MHLTLPVVEAVRLGRAADALPPFVVAVRADGDVVHVDVDPTGVPGLTGVMRLGAALAGVVTAEVRLLRFADGVATFGLAVRARGLNVSSLVNAFASQASAMLQKQGLDVPIAVRQEATGPVVDVGVQAAVDGQVTGVRVIDLALREAAVHVEAQIADDVVLPPAVRGRVVDP